jgi:PPK2 family polyphosphate:nucleotide phosphotransferase
MSLAKLITRFRVDAPDRFRLSDIDPADTGGIKKSAARRAIARDVPRLSDLQRRLYAEDSWAILIILQGIDAAGKDSAIRHVMSGLNPQGCVVHPFKTPTTEDLDHDFLWRAVLRLPPRGAIGIFNRSYYEEVLIARVHPDLVQQQRLPRRVTTQRIWDERFEDINAFERHLVRSGTVPIKFHLRISKKEQARRLLARLDDPAKRWKFSANDIAERRLWPRYMAAYESMIRNTSTAEAPWYVLPADKKWFAQLLISAVIVEVLEGLELAFPKFGRKTLKEMRRYARALAAD